MKTKFCSKCKQEKLILEFYIDKSKKDGVSCWCVKCHQTYHKTYSQTKTYKEYNKEYRKVHRKDIQKYQTLKKHIDLNYKLICYLRTRMWYALKNNRKFLSTMSLTGCDIEYLMYYLQCKFTKGMNWDNYGKWHVDHIKPCASFDLSKHKEQKKCFHYTNLQPLWAEDNFKKGDKL